MNNLDKSQYNINSVKEFFGYLDTYLLSVDKELLYEQANSHLGFYLSFVAMYIDVPSESSRNAFSIVLSANPEQVLYNAALKLIRSVLFQPLTFKTFLISKLLSMLNLNVQLGNINLKLFIGFIFILLVNDSLPKPKGKDMEQFSVNDLKMQEDQNGNYINNLNESVLDILTQYSSFRIFYKILYFNNFIYLYQRRKNLIVSRFLERSKGPSEADDGLQIHAKSVEFFSLNYIETGQGAENIQYNKTLEDELLGDEHYYLKNCLVAEKKLLYPDTTCPDIDAAIESMSDEELSDPKSTDIVLQRIINNDPEFRSITHHHKRIILSKVYMKLISTYLQLTTASFNEIIYVNSDFIVAFLLKNLSIFEELDEEEPSPKRTSMKIDNGFYNDTLFKGLAQFEDYKKYLKQANKREQKHLNHLKFELALTLNEQYIVISHKQLALQHQYQRLVLSKLLCYKHLKLIQIKTEIKRILQNKADLSQKLQESFNISYQQELDHVNHLNQQQLYGYNEDMSFLVDTDDLFAKVAMQFQDSFDSLNLFEDKFNAMKDLFESNLFFCTGNPQEDEANFSEFINILKKSDSQLASSLSAETLIPYLSLAEDEILSIIRPKIRNTVFDSLIGANYDTSKNETQLKEALTSYVNFVAFLIYNFNRQTNNCTKVLILKALYLIFKEMKKNSQKQTLSRKNSIFTKSNHEISTAQHNSCEFYINDLKVLVDIFIRELYNLSSETQLPVINNYLRVFYLLLDVTQLNYFRSPQYTELYKDPHFNYDHAGYKRREILDLLLYLSGLNVEQLAQEYNENGELPSMQPLLDNGSSEQDNTKKLARKCLSIRWLGLDNYIVEKANLLFNNSALLSPVSTDDTAKFFPSPITRTSTANSFSSLSASINNVPTGSTERLTLSKKLSNLRLTNNNTGGSGTYLFPSLKPQTAVGQHYKTTYNSPSPTSDTIRPPIMSRKSITSSEPDISATNGHSNYPQNDKLFLSPTKNFHHHPDTHSFSHLDLAQNAISPGTQNTLRVRKKPPPPPPPPPSSSASSLASVSRPGIDSSKDKKLPPPPPPRSRKVF